jgi:stearoyl-CoA desaturase (Delta-9 desaturase)
MWFDSKTEYKDDTNTKSKKIDWIRSTPYLLMHLVCLAAIWVGFSWVAFFIAVSFYFVRMFFITGFFHRYFSHKAFKTSRAVQMLMAVAGGTAAQRGPLWWAANHRHHHANSDKEGDLHSPRLNGLFWSHTGWIMNRQNFNTKEKYVRDWLKFPELVFLDRFDIFVPILTGVLFFLFGVVLERLAPGLGTNGWQMLIWGFFISTVVLHHATYTINSLSHKFGKQRFATKDDSRNNVLLALLTLGEGWHNNHHYYQSSARQGFYWWEIDITWYMLRLMQLTGLIWDLKGVPKHVLEEGRAGTKHTGIPATGGKGA